MAKKATTTKENPVEEKSIGITPEMEELKKIFGIPEKRG